MANNEKSAALGAGGAIIGIIGGILCFVGKHMDRDLERQFSSVWNTGSRDETGDIFFFIGVALVIIGVLMIVVNIFQYYQPSTSADNSTNQNSDEIVSDFWDCPKCGCRHNRDKNAALTLEVETCCDKSLAVINVEKLILIM